MKILTILPGKIARQIVTDGRFDPIFFKKITKKPPPPPVAGMLGGWWAGWLVGWAGWWLVGWLTGYGLLISMKEGMFLFGYLEQPLTPRSTHTPCT